MVMENAYAIIAIMMMAQIIYAKSVPVFGILN